MVSRLIRTFALGGVLSLSGVALAGSTGNTPAADAALTLTPAISSAVDQSTSNVDAQGVPSASRDAQRDSRPLTLDDAGAEQGLIVHGFFEYPFKTAYITPRGLVVENKGLVMQPVGGLVFPLDDPKGSCFSDTAFIGGIWNSINTHQNQTQVGAWNEVDFFATLATKLYKNIGLSLTYTPFISPPHNFKTEHNIEFAISYDDTQYLHEFALHPYSKIFVAVSGDSTVVTGKRGKTFDVESGIVPGYTYKGITNYPISFQLPVFITVGPTDYWGSASGGNLGVFSASLNASMPLSFIPKRWGNWHADAGFTYYSLLNKNLRLASRILGTGGDSNQYVGTVGIGFNF